MPLLINIILYDHVLKFNLLIGLGLVFLNNLAKYIIFSLDIRKPIQI